MRLVNQVRAQPACAVVLLIPVLLLTSCVMNPASKTYTRYLTGSANPIDVQTGRLMVFAIDSADGGPLMSATVEVVAADLTVRDPHYYRRNGTSDRFGMVTFNDVPQVVNVSVYHPRGSYAMDNFIVAPRGTSEFRVFVDTQGPRTRDECLGPTACAAR